MNTLQRTETLLRSYYEDFHNKAWDKFEAYLSEDFSYFTDNSVVKNKKDFLTLLKQSDWIGEAYSISELNITLSDKGDMAIAAYHILFKGISGGKKMSFSAVETTVFKENEGKLLITHSHTSNKV